LLVTVDLQELLTAQGLSPKLATRLLSQKDPEAVAKVLLNAIYLESQGKLQNGPGYIRAGIEDGYELLPQVANRLESRRKMLQQELERLRDQKERALREADQVAEDEEFDAWVSQIPRSQLEDLLRQAVTLLPRPLVRRDPTLTNPLVRSKVLELAGLGDPEADTENTWDPGF
jgi:hypothetical protein